MQVDDESNQVIRLKAKDGKVFDLSMAAASISELIINASEGQEDSDDPIEIEIDRLSSEGLGKVVEFMNHYKDEKMVEIPSPLGSSSFDEVRKALLLSHTHSLMNERLTDWLIVVVVLFCFVPF